MGIQNPQTISLNLNKDPSSKVLRSDYAEQNAAYMLSAGRYSPARYAVEMCYPRTDSETSPYSYHRIWQTGEPMEIPVRPMFGAYPYSYRILSSNQSGWSLGEFLITDANGDLVLNPNYGTLYNSSLVAGSHSIRIGIWDAAGAFISVAININVGNNGFFSAPTATGNGSGSDANNCMSFANAYAIDETLSPAKNKILFVRGGDYTITNGIVCGTEKPRAVVAYRDEIPNFISAVADGQINMKSSDLMWKGIIFTGWGASAVFRTYGSYYERQSVWRCKIVDALGDAALAKNEAGWFIDAAGASVKPYFLFSEIEFINCHEVAALDWYGVRGLIERQTWTTNKTEIEEPIWYPKASCTVDMRNLTYNNTMATFDASVNGVIDIGNNEQNGDASCHVRYCFIKTIPGGKAVGVNTSVNASSSANWVDHCTVIGGAFNVFNYNADDQVYIDRCVVQNAAGAVVDLQGGGATVTNLRGATGGLVDANGRLLVSVDVGLYGNIVRS